MSSTHQFSCVKCGIGLTRSWKKRRTTPATCRECRAGEGARKELAVEPNTNFSIVQHRQDPLKSAPCHFPKISREASTPFAATAGEPTSFPPVALPQKIFRKAFYGNEGIWHPTHHSSVAYTQKQATYGPFCDEAPATAREEPKSIFPFFLPVEECASGMAPEKLSLGVVEEMQDVPQSWKDRAALLRKLRISSSQFGMSLHNNGVFDLEKQPNNEKSEKQSSDSSALFTNKQFQDIAGTLATVNIAPLPRLLLLTALRVLEDEDEFRLTLLSNTDHSQISAVIHLIELYSKLIEALPASSKKRGKQLLNDRVTTLHIFMFFNVEEPQSLYVPT